MKHAGIKQARRGKAVAQRVSAPKTPKQLPSLEEFRRRMGRPGTPAAQLLREERGKTEAIKKRVPQGRFVGKEVGKESIALLKMLARGNRQIEERRVVPARKAVRRLRKMMAHQNR